MIVIMFMSITLKVSVDLSDLQRPARNPVSDKMLECPHMTPGESFQVTGISENISALTLSGLPQFSFTWYSGYEN